MNIDELLRFLFRKDFTKQFDQLKLRSFQLTAASWCDGVIAAHLAGGDLVVTPQHFGLLKRMQEGIESSRAHTVTVLCQFFDQPKAVDWLLRCMV